MIIISMPICMQCCRDYPWKKKNLQYKNNFKGKSSFSGKGNEEYYFYGIELIYSGNANLRDTNSFFLEIKFLW